MPDLNDSIEAIAAALHALLDKIDTAIGRAARYGVTDLVTARFLASNSVEVDFATGYFRTGFATASSAVDLAGWTFARSSAATMETSPGLVEHFSADVPRATSGGLLVEPERTNLLPWSTEFSHASWAKFGGGSGSVPVVVADAATAPDGSMTADRVTLDLGGGTTSGSYSMLISAAVATTPAQLMGGSVYVKGTAGQSIVFRHVAGAAYLTHTFSGSWERVGRVEAADAASGALEIGLRGYPGISDEVTFDIWGAQLEVGPSITSLVVTTGSAQTRAADVPVISGLAFATPCTAVVEFAFLGSASDSEPGQRTALSLAGASDDDFMRLRNADFGALTAEIDVAGTVTAQSTSVGAAPPAEVQRVAVRIAKNGVRLARNGSLANLIDDCDVPGLMTRLGLGVQVAAGLQGNVLVRLAAVLPLALNDEQLRIASGGAPWPGEQLPTWARVVNAAQFPHRDSARVFEMGGRLFIANGFGFGGTPIKDLWRTADGLNFELVNDAPPYEDWSAVCALNGVIYAFMSEMWKSGDGGLTFTKIIDPMPFTIETDSPVLVVNGKLLAIPGTGAASDPDSGVWEFDPGLETWSQIHAAAWGPRSVPVAAQVQGAIYLYGGFDKSTANVPAEESYPNWTSLNDMWRSLDGGVSWTQVVADMPCQPRIWPNLIAFQDRLYLMAGYDNLYPGGRNFTDLWVSDDGLAWSRVEVEEEYVERHAAVAYSFNGRLHLATGNANPNGITMADIWQLRTE